MTAALFDVDTEPIEHLDFDPACESIWCTDDAGPATHIAGSRLCGCSLLLCTPCTERLRQRFPERLILIHCAHCHGSWSVPGTAFRDHIWIRPL